MKSLFYLLIILFLVSSFVGFCQTIGEIEKTDCFLEDCSFLEKHPKIEFGYITVPEDYTKPNGRKLKIAFSIIKATDPNPQPDPIIYFQGGWGSPIVKYTKAYAENYPVKNRDLILYDYRSIGYSEPQLCGWLGSASWTDRVDDISNNEFEKNEIKRFNQCLDSLELKQIDFNMYGSDNKTRDAVLLAEKLGYKTYNLFGISYGTMSIQSFLRASESSNITVRSAILDSNVPIGLPLHGNGSKNYARALNLIFKDCVNDPECNKAYPELKIRFLQFLDELDANPFIINLNKDHKIYLNREEINSVVFQMLYNANIYKDIPILLETIINRDDPAFKLLVPKFMEMTKEGVSLLAVVSFAYDWNIFREKVIRDLGKIENKYSKYRFSDALLAYFIQDQRFKMDSLAATPIKSSARTLILAGNYDPITPPVFSQFIRKSFENHYYYEAKRVGHGVTFTECGKKIVKTFFDNPNKKPDYGCFDALGDNKIDFRTTYYKNPKIGEFSSILFKKSNWLLIIGLVVVFLSSLINSIFGVIGLFRKSKSKNKWITTTSFIVLLFLIGLGYFIFSTVSTDSFLIVFGLIDQAKFIFYLIPIAFILILIAFYKYFINKKKGVLDTISIVSFALFLGIVIIFKFYPNL